MKAKLFIGLAVATVAIAAATIFAVNHFSPKSQMSDLTRANLEALTNGESVNELKLKQVQCRCPSDGKNGKTLKCFSDGDLEPCTSTQQGSNACYKVNVISRELKLC
jgi:hypothetical protein